MFALRAIALAAASLLATCDRGSEQPAGARQFPSSPGEAVLEGQVVDGLGNPVRRASVWLEALDVPGSVEALTDRAGRFTALVPAGRYAISVMAGDRAPALVEADLGVPAGHTVLPDSLVLRSRPGLVVQVHHRGRPVAGAVATLGPQLVSADLPPRARAALRRRASSGTDGRLVLPAPPLGHAVLEVSAPGFRPAQRALHLRGDLAAAVGVALQEALVATGTLRNAAGAPMAGVELWAEGAGSRPSRTQTGPDGTFRATDLLAGPLSISFADAGGTGQWTFTLREPALDLDLRLPPVTAVRGSVEAADGPVIAEASLRAQVAGTAGTSDLAILRQASAISDAAGRFVLEGLPSGRFSLSASSEGRPLSRIELPAVPLEPLTIVLAAGCRVAGQVRGVLGPEVMVEVLPASLGDALEPWLAEPPRRTRVAADGTFAIGGIEPGRWVLRAQTRDAFAISGVLDLDPRTTCRTDLQLLPGCFVTGTALRNGATLAGCRVQLLGTAPGLGQAGTVTDPQGRFRLGPVAAGAYVVVYASPGQSRGQRVELVLAPGATRDLQLSNP